MADYHSVFMDVLCIIKALFTLAKKTANTVSHLAEM